VKALTLILNVVWRVVIGGLVGPGTVDPSILERRKLWGEAARAVGLRQVEEGRWELTGRADRLYVRLSNLLEDESGGTTIEIQGPDLPEELTVRPESMGTAMRGLREIEIGDEAFDREAWIEGPPALTRSLLDAPTRATLRRLFRGRLEVEGHGRFWASGRIEHGVLRVDLPERSPAARRLGEKAGETVPMAGEVYLDGEEKLPQVLAAALALARRFRPPPDLPARLASNLPVEPLPGVRLRILTALLREFPSNPAAQDALRRALEDPDAEVRMRAAIALGAEGLPVLLAVAGGEGAEDSTNARAVQALGAHLTREQAERILSHALRTRRVATAGACLAALARVGGAAAIPVLGRVLAVERSEIAVAAAEALADSGDATAEAPLVQVLATAPMPVGEAAVRALGRVGTAAAVAPLKEVERRGGSLGREAREAVARIQLRLAEAAGAAPGQVSLASPATSGELSLAPPDERGRLTLSGPPAAARPSPGGSRGT